MDICMGVINDIFRGFCDSLKGLRFARYVDPEMKERNKSKLSPAKEISKKVHNPNERHESKKYIQKRDLFCREQNFLRMWGKCVLLNGILCIVTFKAFGYMLSDVLVPFVAGDKSELSEIVRLLVTVVYQILWELPMFSLAKFMNMLWFSEIADLAYKYGQGRKPRCNFTFTQMLGDMLFNCCVQIIFLIQATLILTISQSFGGPIAVIGYALYFVLMCLLSSLYAFEHLWSSLGMELHQRLMHVECRWAYFLGFGITQTLSTVLAQSAIINACIFSVFFPMFILSANLSTPVASTSTRPIKFFCISVKVSDMLLHRVAASWSPARTSPSRNQGRAKISGPETPKKTSSSPMKNRRSSSSANNSGNS